MTARRTKLIKESGPYKAKSCANGDIRVVPKWPQFPEFDEQEGGGLGLFSRLALARQIEDFLNVGTKEES